MNKKYFGIIFDLDGTIIDSKTGIVESLVYSLKQMGKHDIDTVRLKHYIGLTLEDIYERELDTNDEDIIRKAINFYREDFEKNGVYKNTLYKSIDKLIINLHNNNKKLYIASIKPAKYTKIILEQYGLDRYFDEIVGSGLNGEHNTKEELIKMIIEYSTLMKENLIMIGDREGDIKGAQYNSIDVIGLLFGYGKYEEIQNASPTYIANSIEEIEKIIF